REGFRHDRRPGHVKAVWVRRGVQVIVGLVGGRNVPAAIREHHQPAAPTAAPRAVPVLMAPAALIGPATPGAAAAVAPSATVTAPATPAAAAAADGQAEATVIGVILRGGRSPGAHHGQQDNGVHARTSEGSGLEWTECPGEAAGSPSPAQAAWNHHMINW